MIGLQLILKIKLLKICLIKTDLRLICTCVFGERVSGGETCPTKGTESTCRHFDQNIRSNRIRGYLPCVQYLRVIFHNTVFICYHGKRVPGPY